MEEGIKYLGHSAFYVKTGNAGILIDPWFMHNKSVDFNLATEKVTHIFVTHAHSDHFGDTAKISEKTGAQIIAIFETANVCRGMGLNAVGVGMNAKIEFEWGSARFFTATHPNSFVDGRYAGTAAGILFDFNGIKVYHAGDTGLTKEFEIIGEYYTPYYAMLPIGGHFTMGPEEAAIAAKMLKAEEVIPMHYNTFDVIAADPVEFKTLIETEGKTCHILPINGTVMF